MRRQLLILALGLVVGLALLAGPFTIRAKAQTYDVVVDFALQTSAFVGQDITIIGRVTLLAPLTETDTITATLTADDTGTARDTIIIDPAFRAGTEFQFAVAHFTYHPGEFTLAVSSVQEGQLLTATYPVPNEDVTVELAAIANGLGTEFQVRTVIGLGEMIIVQTRFDVEYLIDGVKETDTAIVQLIDSEFLSLVDFAIEPDLYDGYEEWVIIRTLALDPGLHTVEVRVIDQSIGTVVRSASFSVMATDRLGGLEAEMRALNDTTAAMQEDLGQRMDDLEARSGSLERISGVTVPAAVIGSVALALGVITLLVQLGMLKLGRRPPQE